MDKKLLHGWIMTWNDYLGVYCAVDRDNYNKLFNGGDGVIKSKDINTLQELIMRTGGNPEKLKKLVK